MALLTNSGWRSVQRLSGLASASRSYGKGSRSNEVFVVSSVRTPIGSFRGSLASLPATKLGSAAIKEAIARAKIAPEQVLGGITQQAAAH